MYSQPQHKPTCQQVKTLDGFVRSLLVDVRSGKHVFLFCPPHERLTSKILPMLRQKMPRLTLLEYYRTSPTTLDGQTDINLA